MGFFMGRSWPCCLLRLRQLVLPAPGQELGLHPGPSARTGLLCPCGGSREHSQSLGRPEGCESHLASQAASSGRDLLLPPPAQREFARYGSVWGGHHSGQCSTATLVCTGDRDRQQGGAQRKESPAAPAEVGGVPCPSCTVRGELQARLWPLRGHGKDREGWWQLAVQRSLGQQQSWVPDEQEEEPVGTPDVPR